MSCAPPTPGDQPPLLGGIEGGGTKVNVCLGFGPDHILAQARLATADPATTLGEIIAFFQTAQGLNDAHGLAALGCAWFGPLDLDPASPTWGHVLETPKLAWRGAAVGPALAAALGVPVAVDTDVNAAARGEAHWGAGQGCGSVAYITVGTGIGAGLLVGDRPLGWPRHPEAGHIRVAKPPEDVDFPGICPIHGDCLEGLACGPAIEARWGRPCESLDPDHAAWTLEASYLAQGCAALTLIGAPERIVLGGGVMGVPGLLDQVRRHYAGLIGGYLGSDHPGASPTTCLAAPGLGERSGLIGALALAQNALGPREGL